MEIYCENMLEIDEGCWEYIYNIMGVDRIFSVVLD